METAQNNTNTAPIHPAPHNHNHHPHTRMHAIYTIAVIGFIYTLHLVIPMYSNSSFLNTLVNEKMVGYVYMLTATLTIAFYIIAPHIIRKIGNYKTSIILVVLQILVFYGLVKSDDTTILISLFALQGAIISLIGLSLDIFLEHYTDGNHAGKIRGMYTATMNAAWLIGPLIGSSLINGGGENYKNTYVIALAMLFPLLYLIHKNFPRFKDPKYTHPTTWHLLKSVHSHKSRSYLFYANIILQVFYAWMVVYSPIYMHKVIGFNWESIGFILVVMLIPFPLLQYKLGKIADGKYGEKEIMTFGFALMGIFTILLAFLDTPNVFAWAAILFLTRVGAAAAEIMVEIYFFKTVPESDTSTLGLFRITRPLSTFIAPIIAIASAYLLGGEGSNYIFVVIGVIALLAMYPAMMIRDTK